MVRFKGVKVDPWLQDQGDYKNYKGIPEDAVFACAYYIYTNPFYDSVEAAFLRRAGEKDELWVASWDYEFKLPLPDYSRQGQFEGFGCKVIAPREGDTASACHRLLGHLFRSRVGYVGYSHFAQRGIIAESEYKGIIDALKQELDQYVKAAHANRSPIVDTAEGLGLCPEPTGRGPYSWSANCPGTSHHLFISTESDTFGCGYCRRKGGSDELRDFVWDRRSKK